MFNDFDSNARRIDALRSQLKENDSPAIRSRLAELSMEQANRCSEVITEAAELRDNGNITDTGYLEICDKFTELRETTLRDGVDWYTESVSAKIYKTALNEITALSVLGTKMIAGYMLTKTGKKYIRERLSKYTILNPDAIDARRFNVDTYTIEEAGEKFKIHFKYGTEWENGGLQTYCKVYQYLGKPVMAVAYNREKMDHKINKKMNVETVILDPKMRKHDDYYSAYMCAELQIMHPSIKRVLEKLKSQWKEASKHLDKEITESVDDAIENGVMDVMYEHVADAYKNKFLDQDTAKTYLLHLREIVKR